MFSLGLSKHLKMKYPVTCYALAFIWGIIGFKEGDLMCPVMFHCFVYMYMHLVPEKLTCTFVKLSRCP